MNLSYIKENIHKYLEESRFKNLHEQAFYEVLDILLKFVEEGSSAIKDKQGKLAWICDAVMGSGKTTAIEVLLKYLADNHRDIPLLLVFSERGLMKDIYDAIYAYGAKKGNYRLIEQVHTDNVNDVAHTLKRFQFVCITHQRFRDLTLGYGNWDEYRFYQVGFEAFPKKLDRLIIVDEMPILFDSCVFDISSKDNSVDWFDKLAEESDLTSSEKQFARTMIMLLMTYEMLESEGKRRFTKPLKEGINNSNIQQRFEEILKKINQKSNDFESLRKFKWFKQLLNHEKVGAIDRHSKGTSILCSRLIPYHEKGNIIILDGTAKWNNIIYDNHYEIKQVPNYHSYANRLIIHIKDINTSKEARASKKNDVHGKIASDLKKVREELNIDIFPLPSKSDIQAYIKNNVINNEQKKFYELQDDRDETLPINLLNTRGKNVLSDYNALALLNLPIRNPQYYKLIGIGLYGVDINLAQYETRQEQSSINWFQDEHIQKIYEDSLLADILQIIHRSNLRKINEQSTVHIFLYTHLTGWGTVLKEQLNLPDEAVTYDIVDDKYNFISKCNEYAQKAFDFLKKQADIFDNPSFSAKEITKDESFKNWLKYNWDDSFKTEKIKEIFDQYGIEILHEKKSNGKEWRKFRLKESVYDEIFGKVGE
ncbi:DEAD/DEAH box helicase [Parageobacillus thermoglucosidasius]|uniref:DEAD/DEAH-box helicase domain-containing protein n=1 Tax=Parageobacillus thermoglucosidasius TaxID=1426 RepID=A0AB38QWT5_PARTM|nr:DEAD/DEAH box helicase [Parageobacillus thermoglucosidasius]UOE75843.1 hypothetical protein IMI45_16350 [Parageobacillus thermoglucosidasius]